MAGQVKHVKLFGGVMPDLTLLSVLMRLKAKNTDALIAAVADVLQENGITLMDSTALLADLLARAGVMLERAAPTEAMRADFEFGYRVADAIAGVDVGQTDRRQGPRRRRRRGDGRHRRDDRARRPARPARARASSRSPSRRRTCGSTCRSSASRRSRRCRRPARTRSVDRRRPHADSRRRRVRPRGRRGGHRRRRPRAARERRHDASADCGRSASATSASITRGFWRRPAGRRFRRGRRSDAESARTPPSPARAREALTDCARAARQRSTRSWSPCRPRRTSRWRARFSSAGVHVLVEKPMAGIARRGRRAASALAAASGADAGRRAHRALQSGDSGGAARSCSSRASSKSTG